MSVSADSLVVSRESIHNGDQEHVARSGVMAQCQRLTMRIIMLWGYGHFETQEEMAAYRKWHYNLWQPRLWVMAAITCCLGALTLLMSFVLGGGLRHYIMVNVRTPAAVVCLLVCPAVASVLLPFVTAMILRYSKDLAPRILTSASYQFCVVFGTVVVFALDGLPNTLYVKSLDAFDLPPFCNATCGVRTDSLGGGDFSYFQAASSFHVDNDIILFLVTCALGLVPFANLIVLIVHTGITCEFWSIMMNYIATNAYGKRTLDGRGAAEDAAEIMMKDWDFATVFSARIMPIFLGVALSFGLGYAQRSIFRLERQVAALKEDRLEQLNAEKQRLDYERSMLAHSLSRVAQVAQAEGWDEAMSSVASTAAHERNPAILTGGRPLSESMKSAGGGSTAASCSEIDLALGPDHQDCDVADAKEYELHPQWQSELRYEPSGQLSMDRSAYKAVVNEDGRLTNLEGELLGAGQGPDGQTCMYCVDPEGNLFVNYETHDKSSGRPLRHPALVGGGPVIAAGEMLISDGVLCMISNCSGHYRPLPSSLHVVRSLMRQRRVLVHHSGLKEVPFDASGSLLPSRSLSRGGFRVTAEPSGVGGALTGSVKTTQVRLAADLNWAETRELAERRTLPSIAHLLTKGSDAGSGCGSSLAGSECCMVADGQSCSGQTCKARESVLWRTLRGAGILSSASGSTTSGVNEC